ncbi:hypothetical protein ACIG0C_36705 [Kitasatospora aureofaciens]|uniref:Tetratricopeptide repeat protein n=1 Tax=Kitasatospora aureofaciens TaxID=1894 RepID=A0A1E7NBC8_KITAU|nr:hypothetical protein [Kitasatospora aureofaciens]ARF78092.1 hypothetical protein B6264_03420 [Kitasatospora aureofaciens]OEV37773.1 hypothetical protein HS99_0024580 [Kitasatospora aureofaciens]GGV08426.1 hypothetical protein GCM10010502_74200 [Kitasatospora aureofaciens]
MTRSDRALRLLRGRSDLARLAAFPFDFDLERDEHGEAVRLASGAALEAVAGDDTGGTYFVCADGAVLYASSEGEAGLIAGSVDEALEMLIGLPGWRNYTGLDPHADDTALAAAVAGTEADIRDSYAPELDAERSTLITELELRLIPQPELLRRLHQTLLRTEPDYLLLNADEGCAHTLLDRLPRPPLWQTVLAPGQADLVLLRTDRANWPAVAKDPARRVTALRAAQYDRRGADLPFLRVLLQHEARYGGATEELRLAAALVGLHGQAEDHRLLKSVRQENVDAHYLLGGFPDSAREMSRWATELDESNHGENPEHEDELTWAGLARRQGRAELARCILLRLLDDAGPRDAGLLGLLAHELTQLGDFAQAARARHLYASLQDDPLHQGLALADLASLQRRAGAIEAAWRSLQRAVSVLDGPPPPPATDQPALDLGLPKPEHPTFRWRALGLGLRVTGEHFHIAGAAAQAGQSATARASLTAGTILLRELPTATEDLRQLSREAVAATLSEATPTLPDVQRSSAFD